MTEVSQGDYSVFQTDPGGELHVPRQPRPAQKVYEGPASPFLQAHPDWYKDGLYIGPAATPVSSIGALAGIGVTNEEVA